MSYLYFDEGLCQVERLEVLIASPLLRLTAEQLPAYGMSTKASLAEPAALMVVGAATLICGSDRAADRELRGHWDRISVAFEAAGYRVPSERLRSRHFRDYRDKVLVGGLSENWKTNAMELFVGLAKEIGLFPESDAPFNRPHLDGIVSADGTWLQGASEVRGLEASRSESGAPRILDDVDRKNKYDEKGYGYMTCIVSVRGDGVRRRVVLHTMRAPNSIEMDVVIPVVKKLRGLLGDDFRCFVFDGAMRGIHNREIRAAGIVSVNKPRGFRSINQYLNCRGKVIGKEALVLEPVTGCHDRHLLTVTAGSFWALQPNAVNRYIRTHVLNVAELRRSGSESDGFAWEMDVVIPCRHGDHVFTVDPNATIACAKSEAVTKSKGGKFEMNKKINLSEVLRMVQVQDDDFAKIYGRRNDSESGNKNLKSDFGMGGRAGSYSAERHDTDMWLYALISNALVWAEHAQKERLKLRSQQAYTRRLQAA